MKIKHYCNWSAHQRQHKTRKELVPFVSEDFGDIHPLAVGSLCNVSNYAAQYNAPLSTIILLNYMKMVSTFVQLGVV